MRQFGRRFELIIGNQSDGSFINNLRISFEIRKTIDKHPNPGKLSIWNLTREHMGAILSGHWKTVALSVGYEALRLIYAGDIVRSNVRRDGMDFVTVLECGDGNAAFTGARANFIMPAGSTDAEAAIALAATLPETARGTMAVTRTMQMTRPRIYCGNSRDALSNLARANSADWSVQNGELIMLPAHAALAGEGPLISQETGMVGMPESSDDGLEVHCLCNPELAIGGVVRVQSILPHYSGDFKIVALQHAGDSREGDWLSTITCIGGQFQKVVKRAAGGAAGEAEEIELEPPDAYGPDIWHLPRVYSVDALIARNRHAKRKLSLESGRIRALA